MARDICRIGTRAAYQSEGRLSFFLSLFSFLLLFFYRHLRAIWAIQGLATWSSRHPNTTGLGASTARLALDSAENLHDIILHALRIIATAHPSGYST